MFIRPAKWFLTVSTLSILPLVLAGCCKGEAEPTPEPITTLADPAAVPDPVAPPTAADPLAIDTTTPTTPTTPTVAKTTTVRDASPTTDDKSNTFGKTGAAEKAAAEKAAAEKAAAEKAAADKAAAEKAAAEAKAAAAKNVAYRGDRKTKSFHAPGCSQYRCATCTVVLVGKSRASSAGYRAHSCVR